jgi:transmembrane sensor
MKPAPKDNAAAADAALDDAAAAWLIERDGGFPPGRARAFAAWCAADPRHAAAVARVERTLALLDELPAVEARLPAAAGQRQPTSVSWSFRRFFAAPAFAAAAAVVVLALGLWGFAAWRTPPAESYAAGSSAPRRIALRDGSLVELRAGAAVRVEYSAAARRVALDRGEAHFEVAKDAARPFVVAAGGVAVRAVGTAFNVRLAPASVEVLVTDGTVALARAGDGRWEMGDAKPVADRPAHLPSSNSHRPIRPEVELCAGQRATVALAPAAVPQVAPADSAAIRAALTWRDPAVSFTDAPLAEVVAQFNRRNAVQLALADAELGARRIGGVFALDQAEAFVRLLAQDGDLAADRRGENEIVLRRAR